MIAIINCLCIRIIRIIESFSVAIMYMWKNHLLLICKWASETFLLGWLSIESAETVLRLKACPEVFHFSLHTVPTIVWVVGSETEKNRCDLQLPSSITETKKDRRGCIPRASLEYPWFQYCFLGSCTRQYSFNFVVFLLRTNYMLERFLRIGHDDFEKSNSFAPKSRARC